MRYMATLILALALAACGGGSSDREPATVTTVTLVYRASTAPDPQVAQQFPDCVALVGGTHVHPSWRAFERVFFTANGADEWIHTFQDVPSGEDVSLRISDGNKCSASNTTGWSAENVFANGASQ